MYQLDLRQALQELVELAKPGGWISILTLNPDANAMRSGLQGHWAETVALLSESGSETTRGRYLETIDHRLPDVIGTLEDLGAAFERWEGVGIFTDHLTQTIQVEDPEEVFQAELLAGRRDPYRQVARCFHVIARKMDAD